MRVHWLQHAQHEDLGCIAPWLTKRGTAVSLTRLWAGETLPAPSAFDVLIVMGGPMNIYEHAQYPWLVPEKAFLHATLAAHKRVLGVCLGAQLIADVLGGPVTRNAEAEIGWFEVALNAEGRAHPLFAGWDDRFMAFHWHGDTFAIPPGAQVLMSSQACSNQAYAWGERVLGLQFHLEVTAADARVWFEHDAPRPGRYVQEAAFILDRLDYFAGNNRLMLDLLDRFLA